MAELTLSRSIADDWNSIREVRDSIGALLQGQPEGLRAAAMMTGSELLENAVKYGEPVTEALQISFELSLADDVLRISTVSGSTDAGRVARLVSIIRRIADAEDPAALFESVILGMLEDPAVSPGGGIGLYRIAAEGGFTLACDCAGELVRVYAQRAVR